MEYTADNNYRQDYGNGHITLQPNGTYSASYHYDAAGHHYMAGQGYGFLTEAAAQEAIEAAAAALPTQQTEAQTICEPVLGIGAIGIYAANEMPVIPSIEGLARLEKRLASEQVCKRCGASSLDGAMFTTIAGSGVCDDCI